MDPISITCGDQQFSLRLLHRDDGAALARYFAQMGEDTRRRFGPHPLTEAFADELVQKGDDSADRFVMTSDDGKIAAYFIFERQAFPHEMQRYAEQGIVLAAGQDISFAPSVADAYQNSGVASAAMPALIGYARSMGAKSLVLMGGTQATNERAVRFYEKFGFRRHGGYQTELYNHDMRLLLTE
ncbi:GNAT family N-acetyltransferase [Corallincola spongiicola]|uniref:GNAT family N-acetyltransferase n=1 Tax=Corallincola spongiicola TaxID=2520508 RepID=A0ABY1WUH2_9GAMM|nr:GNAT family N-acetyltransferase [Corallincola spongiicola]TAA48401.1 GNAT family N-acetyltransferase [Corallincola spongiicola]